MDWHKRPKVRDCEWQDSSDSVLVVHCSAGISRSGAIGTFACDYCSMDYNVFIQNNIYIMANPYVLSVLRKGAGMIPAGDHDGIDKDLSEGVVIVK